MATEPPIPQIGSGAGAAGAAADAGGGLGGFLKAAGPWLQGAAFVYQIWSAANAKEKARRDQYQQVDIANRSETYPVPIAVGRVSRLPARPVYDRVSNEWHHRASGAGAQVFAVAGNNDQDANFGNKRDMTFNTATLSHISFNEFLLAQYFIDEAGEYGTGDVVDMDVNGRPWHDDAYKYGQRIVVRSDNAAEPLAVANGVPSTNTFHRLTQMTGGFRINVNPFDGGSRGFYKRFPEIETFKHGLTLPDVLPNGTIRPKANDSNNFRFILWLLRHAGIPMDAIDLPSFRQAIAESDRDFTIFDASFNPFRRGRVNGESARTDHPPLLTGDGEGGLKIEGEAPTGTGTQCFDAFGQRFCFDPSDIVDGTISLGDIIGEGGSSVPAGLRNLGSGQNARAFPQARFVPKIGEANGWFDPFTNVREMIRQALLVTPWADIFFSEGKIKAANKFPVTKAEEEAHVVMELTDDDIFELERMYPGLDVSKNSYATTYSDEELDGAEHTVTVPRKGSATETDYLARDGGVPAAENLKLNLCSTPYHGELIASYNVEHSRQLRGLRVSGHMGLWLLEPKDHIALTSELHGVGRTIFEVQESRSVVNGDGVPAMVLALNKVSYQSNTIAPEQSDRNPATYSDTTRDKPRNFRAVLDTENREIDCAWDEMHVARYSLEAIVGTGGDLSANDEFLARTDWTELWNGRDSMASVPSGLAGRTFRLRVRGQSRSGTLTDPSDEAVVVVPVSNAGHPVPAPLSGQPFVVNFVSDLPNANSEARWLTPQDTAPTALTDATSEGVTKLQMGISPGNSPGSRRRRDYLANNVSVGDVVSAYEAGMRLPTANANWVDYVVTSVPAAIDSSDTMVEFGVRFANRSTNTNVAGDPADRMDDARIEFGRAAGEAAHPSPSAISRRFLANYVTTLPRTNAEARWLDADDMPITTVAADNAANIVAIELGITLGDSKGSVDRRHYYSALEIGDTISAFVNGFRLNNAEGNWADYSITSVPDEITATTRTVRFGLRHANNAPNANIVGGATTVGADSPMVGGGDLMSEDVVVGFSIAPAGLGINGRDAALFCFNYDDIGTIGNPGGYQFVRVDPDNPSALEGIRGDFNQVLNEAVGVNIGGIDADGNDRLKDLASREVGSVFRWQITPLNWIEWTITSNVAFGRGRRLMLEFLKRDSTGVSIDVSIADRTVVELCFGANRGDVIADIEDNSLPVEKILTRNEPTDEQVLSYDADRDIAEWRTVTAQRAEASVVVTGPSEVSTGGDEITLVGLVRWSGSDRHDYVWRIIEGTTAIEFVTPANMRSGRLMRATANDPARVEVVLRSRDVSTDTPTIVELGVRNVAAGLDFDGAHTVQVLAGLATPVLGTLTLDAERNVLLNWDNADDLNEIERSEDGGVTWEAVKVVGR